MMRLLITILAAMVVVSGVSAQLQQTLPSGFETVGGSSSTAFPQNNLADHKWQWHYDSSQFQHAGPIVITELYIRADQATATVAAFNFPSFVVTLCEASTNYTVAGIVGGQAGHNAVFANNILTSAVVRTGPWTSPTPTGPGVGTAPWIPMGLTGSFVYDPTTGNDFIVQIEKCGTTTTWGTSMDGQAGGAGLVGGNRYGDTASCVATQSTFSNNEFVPIVLVDYAPAATNPVAVNLVAGVPILFDTLNGTYSGGAFVTSFETNYGSIVDDPAIDPLVGALVAFSGSYAGTDVTGLSDVIMSPANVDIVVSPGTDELHMVHQMTAIGGGGVFNILGGPTNAIPTAVRELRQNGGNTVTRVGSGSAALDGWAMSLPTSDISLLVRLPASGPELHTLERDYVFGGTTPDFGFGTDGTGLVHLGAVGYAPGSVIFNLFAINPTNAYGTGPLFGLEFTPFQIIQLSMPLGSAPFVDLVQGDGTYFWGLPPGSAAAGMVVDALSIEVQPLNPTFGFVSGIVRVTF